MIILLSRRIINQPTLLPLFRHHPHTNQSKTDYLKTLPRIKKDKSMKKTLSDQKRCFAGGTFFCEFISPLPFSVLFSFVFQFQSKADLARLMYGWIWYWFWESQCFRTLFDICFLEIKYAPVICCTDMIPQGSYPKTMHK